MISLSYFKVLSQSPSLVEGKHEMLKVQKVCRVDMSVVSYSFIVSASQGMGGAAETVPNIYTCKAVHESDVYTETGSSFSLNLGSSLVIPANT